MLMRKFTFLAALAFGALGVNAQDIEFVHNDEILENGAEIEVTELHDSYLSPAIMLRNTGTEVLDYELSVTILEGELLPYCGVDGTCIFPKLGVPMVKSSTAGPGMEIDPQVHSLYAWTEDTGHSVVRYELTYGDVTKTVTAEINYDASVSISDVNAEKSVFVADNQVVYSFDAPAARQLNVYSVTGALVKQEALESAGTVSLNALGKGIYLYEVVENGERVAAHKCVVR